MWTPTHVQVTVHRARNLLPKGKGGTNDAYVTIQLGREKYQTSVRERADNPEWHEECDLPVPDCDGIIQLNVYHRSFLGLDDFLGHISLPLSQFQVYERPRSRWYTLRCKPGKKADNKYRGEIEVKVTFIVQSKSSSQQSLNKAKIRRAGSIKSLASSVGDKLKLPVRSSSFKSDRKLEEKKPPAAIIEPLVSAPQIDPTSNSSVGIGPASPEANDDITPSTMDTVESSPVSAVDVPAHDNTNQLPSYINQQKPVLTCSESPLTFPKPNVATIKPVLTSPKPVQPVSPPRHIGTPPKLNMAPPKPARRDLGLDHSGVSTLPDRPNMHAMRALSRSDMDLRSNGGNNGFVRSQPGFRVPVLKRTQSDADARFVQHGNTSGSGEMSETPLLDTREMAKSLGKLPDETDCVFTTGDWLTTVRQQTLGTLGDKYRSSLGSSIPESIPEDNESLSQSGDETKFRNQRDRENLRKIRDSSRRHTLQGGIAELPKVPAHQLCEGFPMAKRLSAGSIPPEVQEKYADMNRDVLICLAESQQSQLQSRTAYIRDLENYIDNLLVRVMETTPRLLQNPFELQYTNSLGIGRTPQPQFALNKKKPLPNPLKRLQKALK